MWYLFQKSDTMKQQVFNIYRSQLYNLNTLQYRELKEEIEEIDSVKFVSRILETPYNEVKCAHCRSKRFIRWGKRNDLQRYKCKLCNKTFNSLTGTPLAQLHKKGRWLGYAQCLKEGTTVRASAAECCVDKTTSFRWRHRFLLLSKSIKPEILQGVVEGEETYFNRSFKGSKRPSIVERNAEGLSEKVCVFVGRDRNKNTFDDLFDEFNSKNLKESIVQILPQDTLFCSDNRTVYKSFTKNSKLRHGLLDTKNGINVKKSVVHINNVHCYNQSLLKWISRFHGVATKYLTSYLSWYRGLDEFDMGITSKDILKRAKSGGQYNTNHYR